MGNFLNAIGQGQQIAGEVEQVADPLIRRFKSIAAAAAAASLTHPELTTDEERVRWTVDQAWHSLRTVIGFGVDILRRTDANRLVTQYVAQIIAADELAAGLQALSSAPAPNAPPPTEPGLPAAGGVTQMQTAFIAGDGADPLGRGTQIAPAEAAPDAAPLPVPAPQGTEGVIMPPAESDVPQTFAQ